MNGAALPSAPQALLARWGLGAAAVAFGLATLVEGSAVLFGGPAARAEAGAVVPFVLAFNFTAGFVYVAGGAATLLGRKWATWVARALALATVVVFAAFGLHVLSGAPYEARTAVAMTVRSGSWVAQELLLPHVLRGRST